MNSIDFLLLNAIFNFRISRHQIWSALTISHYNFNKKVKQISPSSKNANKFVGLLSIFKLSWCLWYPWFHSKFTKTCFSLVFLTKLVFENFLLIISVSFCSFIPVYLSFFDSLHFGSAHFRQHFKLSLYVEKSNFSSNKILFWNRVYPWIGIDLMAIIMSIMIIVNVLNMMKIVFIKMIGKYPVAYFKNFPPIFQNYHPQSLNTFSCIINSILLGCTNP